MRVDIKSALNMFSSSTNSFKQAVSEILTAKNSTISSAAEQYKIYNAPALREDGTVGTRTHAGRVFNAVVDMLNQTGIGQGLTATFNDATPGSESYRVNSVEQDHVAQYADKIFELCSDLGINKEDMQYCMESIGTSIYRYTNPARYMDHFTTRGADSSSVRDLSTIYPQSVMADATYTGGGMVGAGNEAFGLNTNQLLPDIKMAISLSLLKSDKGVSNKLLHRIANDTGAIQYIVPNDEFYDLAKSQAKTTEERQSWSHRAQLIHLLQNPSPIHMDLIPVVPLKDNDPDNKFLLADGILLPDVEIDLWDMASDATRIGYERTNYTDLLSNKMTVRGVHLKVTSEGTSEYYFVETQQYPAATLVRAPNTFEDSGDFTSNMVVSVMFNRDSMTASVDGNRPVNTKIFANFNTVTEYVAAKISFATRANIMSARTLAHGAVELKGISNTGAALTQETIDFLSKLEVEIIGWEFDVRYSEENYRKTNMAVRSMLDLYTYCLPDGRTIAYEASMRQPDDEHMLDLAATVQAIGFDARNIGIINKTLNSVRDRIIKEKSDPNFVVNFGNQTVNRAFVSGRKINPEVYIGKIDLDNCKNFRTSDVQSDIREYIRTSLNLIVSRMHYRSLYMHNLNGAVPTYNVLATSPMIECLFSIPSIYPHYMEGGMDGEEIFKVKAPNKPVEYTTKLPSGVVLRFVSTTFLSQDNQMVFLPFRDNDPSSDLNFGINLDGGQFTVNFNPVDQNEVNRRTLVNYREYPIVLCPIGGIITIVGMKKFFPNIEFNG